jgi:sterol desaturase/sphingolipid hydroxylase (fatty acid hydroxylase superfamily)
MPIDLNLGSGCNVTLIEVQLGNDSMGTKAGILANADGLSSVMDDPIAKTFRRIACDLAFAVLLVGVLACGTLYLAPAISGKPHRPLGLALTAALLPVGILALLSLIERLLLPAGPRKSLRSWFLHFQIAVFIYFMLIPASIFSVSIASLVSRTFGFNLGLIDLRFYAGKGLLALIGATWLSAIVGDFFFYWFHRTLHKTPFLWQHHKMHHMDRELEALTFARQNWIEAFLSMLFIAIPFTILFKLDARDPFELGITGGIVATVFGTLLTLGHMNVRFQVGRGSLFYCSPQVHRIHHSCLPQHRDKNFAFVLPLWDMLFGTYYSPARDEFPPTGVQGEKEIGSFFESQIFTQREWWKMFWRWCSRSTSNSA